MKLSEIIAEKLSKIAPRPFVYWCAVRVLGNAVRNVPDEKLLDALLNTTMIKALEEWYPAKGGINDEVK